LVSFFRLFTPEVAQPPSAITHRNRKWGAALLRDMSNSNTDLVAAHIA
jgi:hypothetical protein